MSSVLDLETLKCSQKHCPLVSSLMFVMCFGPGGRSASSSSPPASVRAHTEGPSDLLLETSYYNFYQPSRYPTYYSNLYNYQQYQVTSNNHTFQKPCW